MLGLRGYVFQSANAGGADRDDPSSLIKSMIDLVGGIGRDGVVLLMETMVFDALDPYGLKGSEADVQCDFGDLDAPFADSSKNLGREVQTRRGGGDRSTLFRVHGLVAFMVARSIFPVDIRRQGHVADLLHKIEESFERRKANVSLAERAASDHVRL